MTYKLTILIPSIPERKSMRDALTYELREQIEKCGRLHPSLGEVEIITNTSKKFIHGGKTVGEKRQELIEWANGEYLCFIDDDEYPAPNYIEQILRLCTIGTDIVTFRSLYRCDGYIGIANMSLYHPVNEQATPYGEFKRKPFHICPVKSVIAKEAEFPAINNAEDWAYMEQVLPFCKNEVHTDQILHEYRHSAKISAVDEIA